MNSSCEHCQREVGSPNIYDYCIGIKSVSTEPTDESGLVYYVMMLPDIPKELFFCGDLCLRDWLESRINERLR